MFSTLVACGDPLKRFMDEVSAKEETIEVREILARYTTNVEKKLRFRFKRNVNLYISRIGNCFSGIRN